MKIKQILFQKSLCCYPPEEEAAKLFHKFLLDHPEYDINEIKCKIDSVEREEDYYGNGGGYDNTLIIYRYRDETDEELKSRIETRDRKIINDFNEEFYKLFKSLQVWCKDINEKESIEKIVNSVMKSIDYCFKNNYIESEKIKII